MNVILGRSTLPYGLNCSRFDLAHLAGTTRGKVQRDCFGARDLACPLRGRARSSLATGGGGKVESGLQWDVHTFSFPAGVGKRLGRFRAPTRQAAELEAHRRFGASHGTQILVTLAGGTTRRDATRRYDRAGRQIIKTPTKTPTRSRP